MSLGCEVAPTTLVGANISFSLCGISIPVEKVDVKLTAKKTEVTSTASLSGGVIWEEYSPGPSGGSINWEGAWRVGQQVSPPSVRPGLIYSVQASTGGGSGASYTCNLFIDDNSLTLDPRQGKIDWKCSGTATGPVSF